MPSRRLISRTLALVAMSASTGAAQEQRTRIEFSVSPSFITFSGFGGSFGAAVARLSISRRITPNAGAEASVFTVVPSGAASAVPGCIQGSPCVTRTTPSALSGLMLSGYAAGAMSPVRVLVGGGVVRASGGEGFERRSTGAIMLGVEWVSRSTNRFGPSIGVRFAQLTSPLAGARQLFLPGVGLSF